MRFCVLWDEEFESSNWSDDEIVQQLNLLALEKGVDLSIGKDLVGLERASQIAVGKRPKISKLLQKVCRELRSDFSYSKVDLGKRLAESTAERIRSEMRDGSYAPRTEIEKALIRVDELTRYLR